MDKTALVNFDIENGKGVLEALDRAGIRPQVALWAKLPDYEDWRLVIASEDLNQQGSLDAYTQVNKAIAKAGITGQGRPTISLRPIDKPFIKALRKLFGKADSVYGMRLGGQTIADQYLEDAFVYRIE